MTVKSSVDKETKPSSPPKEEVKCFGRSVQLPKLEKPKDVLRLLNLIITRTSKGLLDIRLANSLGQLCNIALRACELVQNQEEIEVLTKRIEELESKPDNKREVMFAVRE